MEERERERQVPLPHEINLEMDAKLDEELIHLSQIGGVSMGVEERRGCHRVPHVHGHDLRASSGLKLEDFHVLTVGERGQKQQPRELVGDHLVRRRTWREEGELRRHRRRHSSHLLLPRSLSTPIAFPLIY